MIWDTGSWEVFNILSFPRVVIVCHKRYSFVFAILCSSNPGRGETLRTRPHPTWGPPSLLYNGYRVSFPGVKRPEHDVNHPYPSSAEVKESRDILLLPSGLSWSALG